MLYSVFIFKNAIRPVFYGSIDSVEIRTSSAQGILLEGCISIAVNNSSVWNSRGSALYAGNSQFITLNFVTVVGAGAGTANAKDGIRLSNTGATVRGCISAYNRGFGFHATGGGGIVSTYSCFYENTEGNFEGNAFSGTGDIETNPWFVGRNSGNLALSAASTCIDQGPANEFDPDGTRSDIGAYPFNSNMVPVITNYNPFPSTMTNYSWGDEVNFEVFANDPEGEELTYEWWYRDVLRGTSSQETITLVGPEDLQEVRLIINDGGYLGITEKVWSVIELGVEERIGNLPPTFVLSRAYPNPFNPSFTIDLKVPHQGNIELSVFNVNGQKVLEQSTAVTAGYLSMQIDGSAWASGSYIVLATLRGETVQTRISLIK